MKTIERQKRRTFLSIFAVAVFLLGGTTGFSQTAPTFTVCPGFPGLVLPAGDGGLTLNSSNIPSLLGVTAVDPDGLETITYSASPSTITCANIGPGFAIAITATDSDGSDVCNITVDVFDGGPFANCNDITINLDGGGMYTLDAADDMALSAGSSACTGISSITVAPNMFDCGDIGAPVQVVVTVEDANTSTAFCLANVTVLDEAPVAVCVAPFSLPLDGSGNATISTGDIDGGSTVGSCGALGLSLDVSSFDCSDVGPNTVTLTVNDGNGQSVTCSTTVTIEDNQAPVANCNDITVALDGSGNYTLTAANLTALSAGSTDNCSLTATSNINSFDCGDLGVNTVTITVSDGTNTDNCSADITVIDNQAPVISNCPSNAATTTSVGGTGDCAGDFSWTHPIITDNCPVNLVLTYTLSGATSQGATAFTSNGASGTHTFNIGVTTITYSVSDGTNSGAPVCSFTVTTTDDEAPTAVNPGNMAVNNAAGQCEATVAWPTLTGSDNCPGSVTVVYDATDPKDGALTILTAGGNDFADFPVGESTVRYTVSDAANPANITVDSFMVNVVDNEAPVITCPAATILAFSDCNSANEMVPDYRGNASITDNCPTGYTVTQSPAPGTLLSSITTPANGEVFAVMLTVTDNFANNLSDNCSFNVTLFQDDEPEPSVPGGILPDANSECGPLVVTAPTAVDGCGNLICGEPFPGGIATNLGPNCGTSVGPCTSTTLTNNTRLAIPSNSGGGINSTITATGLDPIIEDVNVSLDLTHTWVGDIRVTITSPSGTVVELQNRPGVPASTFGCANDNLNVTYDDEIGVTTVENICNTSFTGFNNPGPPYAIEGTFDSESPLAAFVGENPNGDWIINVSDNAAGDDGFIESWDLQICTGAASSAVTQYEFPVGTHNITWVYDDGLGNTSNQLQTITVGNDVIDPVVSCQDITLELDGSGNASLSPLDLQAPIGFSLELEEDFNNNANNPGFVNMSVTATSNVSFTFDWDYVSVDPFVGFEGLVYYVNNAPLPFGNLIANTTGSGTTTVNLNSGDIFTIGLVTTDNLFGETQTVTIDNFSPGFTGDYSLGNWTFAENGVLNSDISIIDGDPSDNCTDVMTLIPTFAASQTAFDCSDLGAAIPVTLSVTDEAGNVGNCIAMVTVIDALGPVLTQAPNTGSVADITVDCDAIPAVTAVFTANDNCDGPLAVAYDESDTQSNNSASCDFYSYEITREWSATDANSNETTVTQVITVEDVDDPVVNGLAVTRNFTAGGMISTTATECTASISLSVLGAIYDCAADADLTITNDSPFAFQEEVMQVVIIL